MLALETGDHDVRLLAHQLLTVLDGSRRWNRPVGLVAPDKPLFAFETTKHLVSIAAGGRVARLGRRGHRDKLGRLLDRISGDSLVPGR